VTRDRRERDPSVVVVIVGVDLRARWPGLVGLRIESVDRIGPLAATFDDELDVDLGGLRSGPTHADRPLVGSERHLSELLR